MSIDLTVPDVGESITEVQIGRWLKPEGSAVDKDDDLVEIETDKASVVVAAPQAGVLSILVAEGESADVGATIARIDTAQAGAAADPADEAAEETQPAQADATGSADAPRIMPAAQRLLDEHGLQADAVPATGPGGRLLKEDVRRFVAEREAREAARQALGSAPAATGSVADEAATGRRAPAPSARPDGERREEIRPMSRIRRTIATRLVAAQQEAALLTTFNEVDMQPVKDLRSRHGEPFAARHGVKLGFMSFFVKASVEALRRYPAVNSEIRGEEIVSRSYHDIGIAIGGGKGLVVPVLRDAATLSFAAIEQQIADFATRAQDSTLRPDELEGGTFTISNGGIYGSLLSTPIVNPPQSGILGMHAIQDRPVVRDGEVVVAPMMYLALTYDHRIIDGREAVSFLRTIKDAIEDPARLLLEI